MSWRRLSTAQIDHPFRWLALMLVTLVPALLLASKLEIKSSFRSLLPEKKPSVIELRRLEQRMGGMGTLIVVVEGGSEPEYRAFLDRMTPRVAALGRDWVTGVSDGTRKLRSFAREHWWLFASERKLVELRDQLTEARDREVMKRTGFDLELDERDARKPDLDALLSEQNLGIARSDDLLGSTSDYYIADDSSFAAIVVRTPFGAGDRRVSELERKLAALGNQTTHELGLTDFRFGFTGSLVTAAEEHDATVRDLTHVGSVGVLLILGIVFFYFLRVRALIAMALTIGVGCAWTFALAEIGVGYLNPASGFMLSIVAGNGINFGILYMARYLEARHEERAPVSEAIARAHSETWAGTLTAAAAAAIAYGSLAVTQFPGFRQFGLIGAVGMSCCWIATYLFLPPILAASEKLRPIRHRSGDWRRRTQWLFAGPLFALARRAPRAVTLVGIAVIVAGAAAGVAYVARDPIEYDLARIRNDDADPHSARALGRRVASVIGRLDRDGRAIVVDRLDQVVPLVAELERRRIQAPADDKPFSRVVSILDLLPQDQQTRVELARQIVELVRQARRRGLIQGAWKKIEPSVARPPERLELAALPSDVAWPFEESDGSRGRVVYLVPTAGRSMNDAHYLMSWADNFRSVRLPNGETIHGSGDPVIFADVLAAVRQEAPRAVLASLLGTVVVIVLAFRLRRSGWLALSSVLGGAATLLGLFMLCGVKINFLDFMALPITIGVGADYAVNVMRRHDLGGAAQLERAFVRTGGAVVLCSLTTIFGYGALLTSINGAVRSFGFAAAAGEVVMLLGATLILPAYLISRARGPRAGLRLISCDEVASCQTAADWATSVRASPCRSQHSC